MKRSITLWFSSLMLLSLLIWPATYAQGFRSVMGKGPETILKRKLAAFVVIKNKRIKLVATAQGNVPKEIAEILLTKLRTDVQKDTGFIEDEKNPETILRFTATAFDNEHRNGMRQSGNTSVPFTVVTANVEVSYQAIETKTNAPVDSENLTATFKQEYPPTNDSGNFLGRINPLKNPFGNRDSTLPPTKSEVQSYLLQLIVTKMAQRATPVEETFPVLLPRGKYDQISKIAQNHAWAKVLEAAATMPPLPKADEDSYRHYLIGVANEALAYTQTSNNQVSEYLFKARQGYEEAKMKHPKEDEYIKPWTRVDEAIKQYDKIMRQDKEYKQFLTGKGNEKAATPATRGVAPPPAPVEKAAVPAATTLEWNNATVINFWKSGNVNEDTLVDFIKNAQNPKFDFATAQGVQSLIMANLPPKVMQAMREKMGLAKPAATSAPPKTPAKKPGRKP